MKNFIFIIIFICIQAIAVAQVENVSVVHPVYEFLSRYETQGLLPHKSLSSLPLERMEISDCLKLIDGQKDALSASEIKLLEKYKLEFGLSSAQNAVVFYSPSDSLQVLSSEIFSGKEKLFYNYEYDNTKISLVPLAGFDGFFDATNNKNTVVGNLGVRFFGTLTGNFGFYLQATNGRVLSGDRGLAMMDDKYKKSIKFTKLNDDIDLTESHLNFRSKWFFASIGRQTRLEGAGMDQRAFISNSAPPMDGLELAAKFSNFEYSFLHASLIGIPTFYDVGFPTIIPQKYMAQHKIAVRPEWGEVAFIEQVIYSGRNTDLAYLNPIGFLKSLEHALHDRDNSLMGLYFTVRPVSRVQIKGSYLLDDIMFEKVGTGYWSNKMAYNLALEYASPFNTDIGAEYSRVEPFTFSHFNVQNSVTNDGFTLGSEILPNSDRLLLKTKFWWGERFPITLGLSFTRHGKNIFQGDTLIYNAGGDPLQTRRFDDPMEIKFLSGDLEKIFATELSFGYEIFRGFHVLAYFRHSINNGKAGDFARLIIRFEDF